GSPSVGGSSSRFSTATPRRPAKRASDARANLLGTECPFSQRFTVLTVMPSACANSSCVSPRRLLRSRMTGASRSTCACPPKGGGEQDECHGVHTSGRRGDAELRAVAPPMAPQKWQSAASASHQERCNCAND